MGLLTKSAIRHLWLYATVFVTGAAVMVIELLGTRLIAPFYGASLYVWTSVIAVTMIALAFGYFTGGVLADRSKVGLSLIVALSGCLTLIIPWLAAPILLATDSLGLRLGSFVSTLALFFPSLLMLGMVSPFAVKLATSTLEDVGVNTGSIYAVSTFGSVSGTLLLGFFLFPHIGSRQIFVGVGMLLLVVAIAISFIERQNRSITYSTLPVLLLSLFAVVFSLSGVVASRAATDTDFETRFEQESLIGWVRVIDNPSQNFRVLTMDSSIIGAASLSSGQSALSYQRAIELLPNVRPGMDRALLVGLGAGHMAMKLGAAGITTDTIEIDPAIVEAANEYFGFTPTGATIVGDARYEVRQLNREYDLIILDVFTGGAEPFHLLTVEYLRQLHSLLTDGGMLALNFVAFYENGDNLALASVAKTLNEVYSHQQILISEPGVDFNDFIFLASDTVIEIDNPALSATQLSWLRERSISIDSNRGSLLTDNLNPLEWLQIPKSEFYRQVVIDLIGTAQLVR